MLKPYPGLPGRVRHYNSISKHVNNVSMLISKITLLRLRMAKPSSKCHWGATQSTPSLVLWIWELEPYY